MERLRSRPMPTGYQGEPGSYSDQAATALFPDRDRIGYLNFPSAFAALQAGEVERLVLPIENSTTGSVNPVLDRLVAGAASIVAEYLLEVRHALLGLPGSSLNDIERVTSHPEALSQAESAIVSRGWEPMPAHDTAGAVRLLAEAGDRHTAALAPARSADLHGLEILMENVIDREHNTTRFIVLVRGEPTFVDTANKSSVAFEAAHRPGALALALTELGLRGANLTRIESRPTERAWSYRMFVDLLHDPGETGFKHLFDPLPVTMTAFHHLGTYPAAT